MTDIGIQCDLDRLFVRPKDAEPTEKRNWSHAKAVLYAFRNRYGLHVERPEDLVDFEIDSPTAIRHVPSGKVLAKRGGTTMTILGELIRAAKAAAQTKPAA